VRAADALDLDRQGMPVFSSGCVRKNILITGTMDG